MDTSIVVILVVFGIVVLLFMNQQTKQSLQKQVQQNKEPTQPPEHKSIQEPQESGQPRQPIQTIQHVSHSAQYHPMQDPRQIIMERMKPSPAVPYEYTGNEPDGIMTDGGAMYSGSLDDDQLKIMDDPSLSGDYVPSCNNGQCDDGQCMVPGSISERCMWNRQTR